MIKVSSILIGVADLNKSKSFYEEILGMTFDEFRPPFASAKLNDVEFNIEENADSRPKDGASKYIGQEIETKPWGWKEAIIADIDGNEFIIEQEI